LTSTRLYGTTLLAAVLIATGGCSGSEPEDDQSVDHLTYVTGLALTGREGFVHVAESMGFFARERLKVAIKPGQAGEFNLQQLRGGQAEFVTIDYAGAVVRAGTGKLADVRCIAVLQSRTTIALMALESSGIRSPRDLPGKTIGYPAGAVTRTLFPAYARVAGLDEQQIRSVKWQEAQGGNLAQLLAARRVDLIGQFVPAAPTISTAANGAPVTVLPYGDMLGDLYGTVLVTRVGMDPDLQRRFTRALFQGLRYAVDHPDEAGQILHSAVPTVTAEGAAAELRLLKPYVGSPQASPEIVARSVALLQGIGMIPGPVQPDAVFDFDVASSASAVAAR
jgi:NitT/TauT family transport system substrate-binding protein